METAVPQKYRNIEDVLMEGLPASLLECCVCKHMISDDFVQAACFHRACVKCWEKCGNWCPVCHCVDFQARSDPLAAAILKLYPRKARCSAPVTGGMEEHEDTCVVCLKVLVGEQDMELKMLRNMLAKSRNAVTCLKNRISVMETAERERLSSNSFAYFGRFYGNDDTQAGGKDAPLFPSIVSPLNPGSPHSPESTDSPLHSFSLTEFYAHS